MNIVPDADFEMSEKLEESEGLKRIEAIRQRMAYGVILKEDKDFLLERAILSFELERLEPK